MKKVEQLYEGKEILPGTRIAKGSKIDIVVGDGLGNTMFAVPDVVGKPRDEAEMLIRGSNLQVGTILPVDDPEKEVGTVVRQNPAASRRRISACRSAVTVSRTCMPCSGSPPMIPAMAAASIPFRLPVLGTTTPFTFLTILPLHQSSARSGRAPRTSAARAAA